MATTKKATKKVPAKKTARKVKPISKRIPKPGPYDAQKDILLPKVADLNDLLKCVRPYYKDACKISMGPEREAVGGARGRMTTRGYTTVRVVDSSKHYESFSVVPSQLLVSTVAESMIFIEGDEIYFEIIVYPDNSSRLYAKYNQIIGSRLVAAFDAKATREFFREQTKCLGYPKLPRVKKAS